MGSQTGCGVCDYGNNHYPLRPGKIGGALMGVEHFIGLPFTLTLVSAITCRFAAKVESQSMFSLAFWGGTFWAVITAMGTGIVATAFALDLIIRRLGGW